MGPETLISGNFPGDTCPCGLTRGPHVEEVRPRPSRLALAVRLYLGSCGGNLAFKERLFQQ